MDGPDDRGLIACIGLTRDVGNGAIVWVEPLIEEASRETVLDGTAVFCVFDHVAEHTGRAQIDIRADKVWEFAGIGSYIVRITAVRCPTSC